MVDDWGLGVKKTTVEEKVSQEIAEAKAESKANTHNVFNVISSAADKKFVPTDEELEKIPTYLFSKYFANDPAGLVLISELNVRNNIPKKWEYWFMRLMMPKSTRFIRFNKKEKFEDEDLLENLKHYYKCNEMQAIEYYQMLPKEEIDKIKDIYRHGVIGRSKK